jgi:signal transduction histidine kinase
VDISHSVVRELLFNVVKHADGAPVTVTLDAESGHAVIRVRDEGPGFDPAGPGGMGLAGIRHRVAALGGSLHVDTALGAGTAIEVRVPLAPRSGAPDTAEEQPEAR